MCQAHITENVKKFYFATNLLHFPISRQRKIPELLINSTFFGDELNSERGYGMRLAVVG
jgi:hypothetical protein